MEPTDLQHVIVLSSLAEPLDMTNSFDLTTSQMGKGKKKQVKENDPTRKQKASWTDYRVSCFIDICLEDAALGNKPSSVLNKTGYDNLERKFKERTNISYNKVQLKNHWDLLKKDWQQWNFLEKQTGGKDWSEEKKTFSFTDDQWVDFFKVSFIFFCYFFNFFVFKY